MPVYKNEEIDCITDFNKGLQYNYSPNNGLQTSVFVKFIIDKKGRLVNPEIEEKMNDELTPLENGCIKSLSSLQNWSCGKKDGVPVNVFCKRVIRVDYQN